MPSMLDKELYNIMFTLPDFSPVLPIYISLFSKWKGITCDCHAIESLEYVTCVWFHRDSGLNEFAFDLRSGIILWTSELTLG